ncbi:MAG: hypothetical protein RL102_889 [Actinomycetota bacterium]|jgi:hypothetical protein
MNLNDLFQDLESRFESLLRQQNTLSEAQAIEVQFVRTAPREFGGGGHRILLISPQIGADFIAGIDHSDGNWWAFSQAAIKLFRVVELESTPLGASHLTRTETNLAQLAAEWFTPIRLRLFTRDESQGFDAQVSGVAGSFLSIGLGKTAIQLPIANLLAVRARFSELVCA